MYSKLFQMRKIILLANLIFINNFIFGQIKTQGTSDLPKIVNFSDTTLPDFNPTLTSVDHKTIPASEYGNKKDVLYRQRMEYLSKNKVETGKKKISFANDILPKIELGYKANIPNGHPADNDIAVSNGEKVISAVNTNIVVYNNQGTQLLSRSLQQLISQIGTFTSTSDPRVLYDSQTDRFIFTCFSGSLSTNSTIIVGFSKTNDPAGAWNFYKLNGNSFNDSTWSDYPIIAVNGSDLFITFNHVKDNVSWTVGFKQSVIWQIDKTRGYQGDSLKYTLWSDIKYNNRNLRNICPAKYQSEMMPNNMYFLSVRNVDFTNDTIFLLEITNSYNSANAAIKQKVLKSPVKYGFPPNAFQGKSTAGIRQQLMTNDARILAAIYENDYIHFGSNSINPQYANAGVFLGKIENVSSAVPRLKTSIFSSSNIEYGYPSMTMIGNNAIPHKVLYTFSHCVYDSTPGMSMIYQNTNGEFSDIVRVKNGTNLIDMTADSIERWGDYSNAQRIYNNPNNAYLVGSWGGPQSGFNTRMLTWVAKVSVDDTTSPVSSIQNLSSNSENMSIFPNPTQQFFTTTLNLVQNELLNFEIYGMDGKKMYTIFNKIAYAGKNEFSMSIQDLPKGSYLLKVEGNRGFATSKVVVKE